jgi:hypothetical protein
VIRTSKIIEVIGRTKGSRQRRQRSKLEGKICRRRATEVAGEDNSAYEEGKKKNRQRLL